MLRDSLFEGQIALEIYETGNSMMVLESELLYESCPHSIDMANLEDKEVGRPLHCSFTVCVWMTKPLYRAIHIKRCTRGTKEQTLRLLLDCGREQRCQSCDRWDMYCFRGISHARGALQGNDHRQYN